jgi:hypothetical protein
VFPWSMAVAVGFEPTEGVNPHALSRYIVHGSGSFSRLLSCGLSEGWHVGGTTYEHELSRKLRRRTKASGAPLPPKHEAPATPPRRPSGR